MVCGWCFDARVPSPPAMSPVWVVGKRGRQSAGRRTKSYEVINRVDTFPPHTFGEGDGDTEKTKDVHLRFGNCDKQRQLYRHRCMISYRLRYRSPAAKTDTRRSFEASMMGTSCRVRCLSHGVFRTFVSPHSSMVHCSSFLLLSCCSRVDPTVTTPHSPILIPSSADRASF